MAWMVLFFGVIYGYTFGPGFSWAGSTAVLVVLPLWWVIGYKGLLNRWTGNRMADGMTGFRAKTLPPDATSPRPSAGRDRAPMPMQPADPPSPARTRTPDGYIWRPDSPIPPTYFSTHAAPMDWSGFIQSMALRVEEALGPGYSVLTDGYAILLAHAGETRRVELSGSLRTMAADPTTSATSAGTKILDAVQAFKIRELGRPWPTRGDAVVNELVETTMARGKVSYEHFELRMAYADELGPVLELQPIPLMEGHPEPDGPVRLA